MLRKLTFLSIIIRKDIFPFPSILQEIIVYLLKEAKHLL